MPRRALTIPEKMIKVDHAGENGAVNIYRAQILVATLRAAFLKIELTHNLEHELEHRQIFKSWLAENDIRRCVSYHLCGIGGFGLGFLTGLIGPKAVHATTYAVENVVLEHLEHQLETLAAQDPSAAQAVAKIIEDEKSHRDHAADQLVSTAWLTKIILRLVKFCTECVIRFGMR